MLEARELAKSWPDFRLGLSFRLERGEIAAMLGPSGSGKSTLLRLLAGLEELDSGQVLAAGVDVSSLPPERRGIGMVFQDFALFPHLSVRRNIEYGPRMRGDGRAERRRAAEEAARSFEVAGLLDRPVRGLSGGEKQRVALARALAARPSVLLLDEPLSSLDAALRLRLRAEIARKLREAEMTALLVTHDAREALAIADRILLMRSGSLDSEGAPEALFASPPTAWSADFLGRGPVLEILALRSEGGAAVAETVLGAFECRLPSAVFPAPGASSLFFPADAPAHRASGGAGSGNNFGRNRFRGRVVYSSFEGEARRIGLACPSAAAGSRSPGAEILLELRLPTSARPSIGEIMEFRVSSDSCIALPGVLA